MMPRRCTICDHGQRAEFDRALGRGAPLRDVAGWYGLTKSSVERHRNEHLPRLLTDRKAAEERATAADLLADLRGLQRRAEQILDRGEGMPLELDVETDELARGSYGFVGADLAALTREAAMEALRRYLPNIDLDRPEIPGEIVESIRVERADFLAALKRVQPSAMREIMIQVPDVTWAENGGLETAKQSLRERIQLPLRHPEAFKRLGIRPESVFLLYGPPGTGKTLLAKAVASEAEANFIATTSSDLLSNWYGEAEQQISRLFARARQVAPTVIFIDEIDSLAPHRGGGLGEPAVIERVLNTMLAEMDGLEELQGVVVVGATNRPTLLNPGLLRPGRFDELIYVPVPDEEGRLQILGIHTREMPLADDVDLEGMASRTHGYTGRISRISPGGPA